MYCRDGNYPVVEILAVIVEESRNVLKKRLSKPEYNAFVRRIFNGRKIKMDSLRYQVFKVHGITCVTCGLVATHFGLEAFKSEAILPDPSYHFNLYGMRHGKEIMFTKDHVHPKSKGGKDHIENMQTMCEVCNGEKGAEISS